MKTPNKLSCKKKPSEKAGGIYDSSPDFDRALAMADSYIGDWSSVVWLYGMTGKAIHIMEEKWNIKDNSLRYLSYNHAVIANGRMWLSNNRFNGLFSVEMKSKQITFHGKFLEEENIAIHKYVVWYKNKLFFLPDIGKSIASYDMDTGEFASYSVKMPGSEHNVVADFVQWGHILWLVPIFSCQPLLRFNMETGEVAPILSFQELLKPYVADKVFTIAATAKPLLHCIIKWHNAIWFPVAYTRYMACYHLESEELEIFEAGDANSVFGAADFDGKDFWIFDYATAGLVRWNLETGILANVLDLYEPDPEDRRISNSVMLKNGSSYQTVNQVIVKQGKVYIFPMGEAPIICLDIHSGAIKKIEKKFKNAQILNDSISTWQHYYCVYADEEGFIISPFAYDRALTLKYGADELEEQEPLLLDDDCFFEAYKRTGLSPIDCSLTLNEFLNLCFCEPESSIDGRKQYFQQFSADKRGESGKAICELVKKEFLHG